MSINLENLVNYSLNCYKNVSSSLKETFFDNKLNLNYDFVNLKSLKPKIDYDEMILIDNLFSSNENMFYQFINCLLLIDSDDFLKKNNYEKKIIITEIFNSFKNNVFSYEKINSLFIQYNYNLIVIDDDYHIFSNGFEKFIIIVETFDSKYHPLYNINKKYYDDTNIIIKEILENYNEEKIEYFDLQTNDDFALEITEKECKSVEEKKILNKKEDVFISCNKKENIQESEIFNKTVILTKEDKEKLIQTVKKQLNLEKIQEIAIKLDIPIISGIQKNGKPKNRKKEDIYNDIKNYSI